MRAGLAALLLAGCSQACPQAPTPRDVPPVASACPEPADAAPLPPIVAADGLRANRDDTLAALERTRRALRACEARVRRNARIAKALEGRVP